MREAERHNSSHTQTGLTRRVPPLGSRLWRVVSNGREYCPVTHETLIAELPARPDASFPAAFFMRFLRRPTSLGGGVDHRNNRGEEHS